MTTTTIRVSTETRDLLHDLAHTAGTSMQQVLDAALQQYRREQFFAALNRAYAAAQGTPVPAVAPDAQATEADWDATLNDGLDPTEVWYEA